MVRAVCLYTRAFFLSAARQKNQGRFTVKYAKEFLKAKLADWAEGWLLNLRQDCRAVSRVLAEEEVAGLSGYFEPDLLATVRVALMDRIPNPPFFENLPELGLPVPWNYSDHPGLALIDTAVFSAARVPNGRWISSLFRECVHLQQFQALGVSKFVSRYVQGLFANGFNYAGLPMERQAEDLQFRFDAGLKMFSVEREVGQAIMAGAI
jgi:hypothetical protein